MAKMSTMKKNKPEISAGPTVSLLAEGVVGNEMNLLCWELLSTDGEQAARAARRLGEFGGIAGAAVPQLIAAGSHGNVELRQAVIAALGRICAQLDRCLPFLGQALRTGDAGVRQLAVAALGEFQDARVLPLVVAALRDEDPVVRQFAVDILQQRFCVTTPWLD